MWFEEMFGHSFYLTLVNGEFAPQLAAPIKLGDQKPKHPRILQRIETYLANTP